jgi:hypothetical protein
VVVEARNLHRDTPVYLMVFGVDAQGDVHWIQPVWSDPAENPASVVLPPDDQPGPPPEAIAPEAPALGRFRVVCLLSRAPLRVRAVEALLRAGRPLADRPDRHLTTLEVEMGPPPR